MNAYLLTHPIKADHTREFHPWPDESVVNQQAGNKKPGILTFHFHNNIITLRYVNTISFILPAREVFFSNKSASICFFVFEVDVIITFDVSLFSFVDDVFVGVFFLDFDGGVTVTTGIFTLVFDFIAGTFGVWNA